MRVHIAKKLKSFQSEVAPRGSREVPKGKTKFSKQGTAKKANPLPEKKRKEAKELQRLFANCLRRPAVIILRTNHSDLENVFFAT